MIRTFVPRPLSPATPFLSYVERSYLPIFLSGAQPRYVQAVRQTADCFCRLVGDLPIGQIGPEHLAEFKRLLCAQHQGASAKTQAQLWLFQAESTGRHFAAIRAASTANKHLRQLGRMLSKLGPPQRGLNADALGILPRIPAVMPYRVRRPRPPKLPVGALDRIYAGCQWAVHPRVPGISATAWWQALVVCAFCETFRRAALIHASWTRGDGLRWAGIDLLGRTIHIDAGSDKMGIEREKPLHDAAVAHLLRIRSGGEFVFPFPASESTFYREWHTLQNRGGLATADHIRLHAVKSASMSAYARESPWVAQFMGDHASIATGQHYIDPSEQAREAVERLRVPEVFLRRPDAG
jgi:integrase